MVEKRRKPKGKRKRKFEEYEHYDILISNWDYYYGFHISDPKSHFDHGPYSELSTIEFVGGFAEPEASKFSQAQVTLSSKEGMLDERRFDCPRSIGGLSSRGDIFAAYIFVPSERFAELAAIVSSGRVQALNIYGTRLRYRLGSAINIALTTRLEVE